MDLEIADYERTVKSLHEAVAERDAKVQTLHEEIQCKEQQQASLQKLLGILFTCVSYTVSCANSVLLSCVVIFCHLVQKLLFGYIDRHFGPIILPGTLKWLVKLATAYSTTRPVYSVVGGSWPTTCAYIINIWNSLPNWVVSANTTNTFKTRLNSGKIKISCIYSVVLLYLV